MPPFWYFRPVRAWINLPLPLWLPGRIASNLESAKQIRSISKEQKIIFIFNLLFYFISSFCFSFMFFFCIFVSAPLQANSLEGKQVEVQAWPKPTIVAMNSGQMSLLRSVALPVSCRLPCRLHPQEIFHLVENRMKSIEILL